MARRPRRQGLPLAYRQGVEDVADAVRPAALEVGLGEGLGDGRGDPAGPVGGHQDDGVGVEPALDERAQQAAPLGRRLGCRLAVVEQLPVPCRVDAVDGEDDPLPGPAGQRTDTHRPSTSR